MRSFIFISAFGLLLSITYAQVSQCPTADDLVKAASTIITPTRDPKDFDFDKSPAAADRLNNTVQRLHIDDRDGFHTYKVGPVFEFNFGEDVKLKSITTRGVVHHLGVGYIKTYKLKYKKSGDSSWTPLNGDQVYIGNVDGSTRNSHTIQGEITAQYLKLESITEYHELEELGFPQNDGITGLRVEINGCLPVKKESGCKTSYADLVKLIPTSSITPSRDPKDFKFDSSAAASDRLNNTVERLYIDDRDGFHTYKVNPYVEFDFGSNTLLRSIATRGLVHHLGIGYVKKYKVLYKRSVTDSYSELKSPAGSVEWVGNTNGKGKVTHKFQEGTSARYIKFQSLDEYHELEELGFPKNEGVTGMRIQIDGCIPETPKCPTSYGDVVKAISLDNIEVTTVPKDFEFDRSAAANDRLNNTKERLYIDDRDGWHTYKVKPAVTFNFGADTELKGITTRGLVHHLGIGYIEKYKLLYKKAADSEFQVLNSPSGGEIWTGNKDGNTEVSYNFNPNFVAQYLKLQSVEEYHELEEIGFPESEGVTGLRIKVVGCLPDKKIPCPSNKWTDVVKKVPLNKITVTRGAKDFDFDKSAAASDRLNNTVERLYIDDRDGWHTYEVNPSVEIDLGQDTVLRDISTRGLVHHLGIGYVKKYELKYKPDGESKYKTIKTTQNKKVFTGNTDGPTVVTNAFPDFITARHIKFHSLDEYHELEELGFPKTEGVTGLRMRIMGCETEQSRTCTENSDIVQSVDASSITVSRVPKDFDFDKSPAASDRLNNTVQRLYINDRDGWHTYKVNPHVEINIGKDTEITALEIRGLKHHLGIGYVRKFKFLYKKTSDTEWRSLSGPDGEIWTGNSETNPQQKVKYDLPENFEASVVKIQSVDEYHELEELGFPKSEGVTGMRLALIGCF